MTADQLLSLASTLVLPGWLLLIFAPRWRYSAPVISGVVIPALLAVLYAYLVVRYMFDAPGGFGTIADVRLFFSHDYLLLAGWVHYLAFDLFIGSWVVRDAQGQGIHHMAVVPCLPLTFMLGPIGLLVYFLIRWGWKRRLP